MNEKITTEEIVDKIVNEEIKNPDSGFKDRVKEFRDWILECCTDYWDLVIFGDSYLLFYDFAEEEVLNYVKANTSDKIETIKSASNWAEPEEIVRRTNNFVTVLSTTAKKNNDFRYLYALFRLLYVLTGEEHFLTMMNLCPYEYLNEQNLRSRPEKGKDDIDVKDVPMRDHGVMFQ